MKVILKVIGLGTAASLFLGLLLWWLVPNSPATGGLFRNDFARRWDGTCSGWTQGLAKEHLVGDLLAWWGYVTITVIIWKLHPTMKAFPRSKITVALVGLFIMLCGATHLFEALSVFNPVYVFTGQFKIFSGVVGGIALVFIADGLTRAFRVVEERRRRAEELEAKELKCGK